MGVAGDKSNNFLSATARLFEVWVVKLFVGRAHQNEAQSVTVVILTTRRALL